MSSYQVLARKWRPQQFGDMIGQEHVLRALVNALDNQRIHHAYLFTGMRGVGKTTIARIFAKCLNCETKGVSSDPCGTCTACQDIDAGRFFDLIEVDAASRTKVDETRELLENVPYAPASGRYKVYLIDEVHMFSTHSFNALLKTLEEPPEHVKFLLATTDPQKVPVTVLSRCLQFNLKRMASTRLADYLSHILDSESMAHDKPALELIARAADGSVRDGLSLVEQAAAFGGGEVRSTDVESMLGRVSTDRLIELLAAIAEADAQSLFERVNALAEYSPDYVQVTGEMLSLLHRVAMIQSVPASVDDALSGNDKLKELAANMSAEEVQLYYQIGQHARRDMPYSSDQREAFDMALLRMIAFAPQTPSIGLPSAGGSNAMQKPSSSEKPPATSASVATATAPSVNEKKVAPAPEPALKKTESPATDAPVKKNSTGRELAAAALAAANAPDPVTPVGQAAPAPANEAPNTAQQTGAPQNTASHQPMPAPVVEAQAKADAQDDAPAQSSSDTRTEAPSRKIETVPLDSISVSNWAEAVDKFGLSGMPRQLAMQSVFNTREGAKLHLHIEADQAHLNTAQFRARMQTAISEYTRSDVTLEITEVTQELNTPARIEQEKKDQALQAAKASIEEDPLVKQLLSSVDGVVDANSVQPVSESPSDSETIE